MNWLIEFNCLYYTLKPGTEALSAIYLYVFVCSFIKCINQRVTNEWYDKLLRSIKITHCKVQNVCIKAVNFKMSLDISKIYEFLIWI